MRELSASFGGSHNARVKKTWRGSFPEFVKILLSRVPETMDKASNGWVCGATFDPEYRHSDNFVARHFLSLDYDHIKADQVEPVLDSLRRFACLAYTTWSHTAEHPRFRVWMPLERGVGFDEFQAVSRRIAGDAGISLAARESHTPCQYMFRPAVKPFDEIQVWKNLEGPWIDPDEILRSYDDWSDRSSWPKCAEHDNPTDPTCRADPREKPGLVGAFCRAFSISDAIERFGLPYKPGSTEGRWTYTEGSRADGAVVYDDDTKLHSHHDTDPAHGQHNAYDLVRLHEFGWLDEGVDLPLSALPSSKAMVEKCAGLDSVREQLLIDEGFEDLDATDTSWLQAAVPDTGRDLPAVGEPRRLEVPGPARIVRPVSELTDQGNARRIQARQSKGLICAGKTFYRWDGKCWEHRLDRTYNDISYLSQIIKKEADKKAAELQAKADEEKRDVTDDEKEEVAVILRWAQQSANFSRTEACENMLRKLLRFDPTYFNRDPYLFTCPNGTVDLRTGAIKPHDPLDYITACAPVSYDVNAEAPRFKAFLHEIFNGDTEMVAFLKRWLGYCLTGSVKEHAMVFHVGSGGAGKSTLMHIMEAVLGSGYYTTGGDGLLIKSGGGPSSDKANLLGRRMVTIMETEEGMKLPLDQIKALTGGDTINARHMYKDPIEFRPTHKLQIFTNHAPVIRDMDESMWRRVIYLKYPNRYGTAQAVEAGEADFVKDPDLEDTIKQTEAQGVLCWLIEGAKEWFERGLQPPASVLESTRAYRHGQDIVGTFVAERLVKDASARTALSGAPQSILQAYKGWCEEQNYRPLGRARFQKELERVFNAAPVTWKEGSQVITGFEGFRLTAESLDD